MNLGQRNRAAGSVALMSIGLLSLSGGPAAAADAIPAVASPADSLDPLASLNRLVQPKVVKIFGAGGFGGLESYQSGFFVTDQGHIVTSWSTVLDVAEVRVLTADGTRLEATVVGSDPQSEIAVLKVDLEGNDYFPLEGPPPSPGHPDLGGQQSV